MILDMMTYLIRTLTYTIQMMLTDFPMIKVSILHRYNSSCFIFKLSSIISEAILLFFFKLDAAGHDGNFATG